MAGEVIREFLVSLGFKQDEASAQKFGESIASMTKLAVGLGVALEGMAATAMFAAQRVAASYADLQTESRNVGASAEHIKTYTYAISQLGGTVEEALGSIKNFGNFVKSSPGNVAWVETFTGHISNAKGEIEDTAEALDKLVNSEKFKRASEWQKRQFAGQAGISINTWKALIDPQSRQFLEESRRVNQGYGLDPDALAKQGRAFTQEWQAIWLRIRAIRDRFLMGIGFEDGLKKFKDYLDANKDKINENLEKFVEKVKPLVIAFSNAIGKLIDFAGAVVKWLGPDTTAWLAVAGLVVKFTGLGPALSAAIVLVGRLAAALAMLIMGAPGAALKALGGLAALFGAPAVAAMLGGAAALYPGQAGAGEDEFQRQRNIEKDPDYYKPGHPGAPAEPKKKSRWERTKDWFKGKVGIEAEARETAEGQPGGGGRIGDIPSYAPQGGDTRADKNFNPGNIAYGQWARAHGATGSAGTDTGHGVAVFPSAQAGFEAMHDLAMQKYRGGKRTANQLIAGPGGWTPGNYEAAANVARSMGLRPDDDLQLNDPSRMRSFQRGLAKQEGAPRLVSAFDKGKIEQERAARRPEVEPQNPVHIPERRRTREDERWDNRPQYDYSKPGAPIIAPPQRQDGGTGIQRPGGVSPRTPIGHVSSSNVRHGDANLNAKTTINVTTPGDPGAAARSIAGAQNNVNADLIRNMRGAAR